jgi:predicted ATPase/class 3 adenylate cyclase/DNA-binding CsgD family transcriptional regulator/predicted Ser/Thr protein kinase
MAYSGRWEGQQLGNYQLIELLGQGHWASVYLGEHRHLHTQAAIKVLQGPWEGSEVESFLGEARTLAHLRHPNIVRVLDFGVQEGTPFLVMEYAPGGTLRQLHHKGTRLPLQTVVSYVKQVASALQYAHAQRLIHRDLKPENLLLGPEQQIWLSDFGLALMAQSARSQLFQQAAGTLAYMAPEQLEGHPMPASDQYALGVLVYEWLAGERPFSGPLAELAVKQTLAPPPALTEKVPTLPAAVEQVVLQALAKDPQLRFASVEAFARALEEACSEDASRQTLMDLASGDTVEAAPKGASMPHLPRGTVTLLFTDMEGSTKLLQQLGERYTQVPGECRRLLRGAFRQSQGHQVDTQDDAFIVAFARATDAISAAVAAQRALARYAWPEGVMVRVRMGLHTGEPELSPEGYVGLDVQHAARIMSAAHGGQVLLSQTTRDLVEHDLPTGVSLRDLGEHRLKDLQRPTRLFQLAIAELPADFPPLKTLDAHPHNLPVQPTPFIGREQEVVAVGHLLQRKGVCLVTLTGPGGVGKTRMALQVAAELSDRFADGVFFVNLAAVSDPTLVVPTIAQTLDIREGAGLPLLAMGIQEVAGLPLLERLKKYLQHKQMLLLLDNFEQVSNAAVQVADLLAACQELKVLVTSRAVLHIRAEHEFLVPPLASPDPAHLPDLAELPHYAAVALFLERAQATKLDFQLTAANARATAEICVRLDGLPLAIELAAARIKLLPPQALLTRLSSRLTVLTRVARDVPIRQQTLRDTLAWSYQLLNATEQRLFRRLAVFSGSCTLEAAEAVCITETDDSIGQVGSVLDGITSLIDKSLLQQTEQEGEEARLVMLETVREYAWEVLATSAEAEGTQRAHAAYYLWLSEEAESRLTSAGKGKWLDRLQREHENLRAALVWLLAHNEQEAALRLGGALVRFWVIRGHLNEGRTQLARALAGSQGAVATPVRAKALCAAGALACTQGDNAEAEALCGESLSLFRALEDRQGSAVSLMWLGRAAWQRSDYAAARTLLEEAVSLYREVDDRYDIATALGVLAFVYLLQGEYDRARTLAEEAAVLGREAGDSWDIATFNLFLATVLYFQGDLARAHALLEESIAFARRKGYKEALAIALFVSGQMALQQGDYATARAQLEEGLALSRALGDRQSVAQSLMGLAGVSFFQSDYATARVQLEESLTLFQAIGNTWFIAICLGIFAGLAAVQGAWAWVARLLGAAEALCQMMHGVLPSFVRDIQAFTSAAARAQLGEDVFTAAWAEGRTMTPEQALAAQGPVTTPATAPAGPSPVPHARKGPTYPGGLTARELEVLHLVAQGLTNEQVAEQLVISPRTVDTHLTSIYSKIGVSSRAAATRYAMEHHLV